LLEIRNQTTETISEKKNNLPVSILVLLEIRNQTRE